MLSTSHMAWSAVDNQHDVCGGWISGHWSPGSHFPPNTALANEARRFDENLSSSSSSSINYHEQHEQNVEQILTTRTNQLRFTLANSHGKGWWSLRQACDYVKHAAAEELCRRREDDLAAATAAAAKAVAQKQQRQTPSLKTNIAKKHCQKPLSPEAAENLATQRCKHTRAYEARERRKVTFLIARCRQFSAMLLENRQQNNNSPAEFVRKSIRNSASILHCIEFVNGNYESCSDGCHLLTELYDQITGMMNDGNEAGAAAAAVHQQQPDSTTTFTTKPKTRIACSVAKHRDKKQIVQHICAAMLVDFDRIVVETMARDEPYAHASVFVDTAVSIFKCNMPGCSSNNKCELCKFMDKHMKKYGAE